MKEDCFVNLNQVVTYLQESGYQCSYKKIKRATVERELVERRGGGWTKRTVDQYARAYLKRKVDTAPESDAPLESPESASAAERKIEGQADIMALRAIKERIDLAERFGRLTKTAIVEAELGERARAFRLGLERFGYEQAESVAELFGGSRRNAEELAKRLNIPVGEETENAVAIIVDFCMQRSEAFPRFFAGKVDILLDAYADGRWWTEEMREAWDSYTEFKDEDIPEVPDAIR